MGCNFHKCKNIHSFSGDRILKQTKFSNFTSWTINPLSIVTYWMTNCSFDSKDLGNRQYNGIWKEWPYFKEQIKMIAFARVTLLQQVIIIVPTWLQQISRLSIAGISELVNYFSTPCAVALKSTICNQIIPIKLH